MSYELRNGETVDLSRLPSRDVEFLLGLMDHAQNGEDYFDPEQRVCGRGAYRSSGRRGP